MPDDRVAYGHVQAPRQDEHRLAGAGRRVVMHLEDGLSAVIVEGRAALVVPSHDLADRLVAASVEKYGYSPGRDAYAAGAWALRRRPVLAWNDLSKDASRFRFVAKV